MTSRIESGGFPPAEIATLLRVEGFIALAVSLAAYQYLGGNWWLFAVLFLAPDLAMLGALRGPLFASRLYNSVHTYVGPAALGALAGVSGATYLLPFAAIWGAHIGMDRTLGYGLKYPGTFDHTHIGLIGKARKAQNLANPS